MREFIRETIGRVFMALYCLYLFGVALTEGPYAVIKRSNPFFVALLRPPKNCGCEYCQGGDRA